MNNKIEQPSVPIAHSTQVGNQEIKYLQTQIIKTDIDMTDNIYENGNYQYDLTSLPNDIEMPNYINQIINNQEQSSSFNDINSLPMKYNIIDLYWIKNDAMYQEGYKLQSNEAQFITISYNIDFGNLKISFFQIPNDAMYGNNVLFRQSLKLMTSGTIYPTSCFEFLSKIHNKNDNNTIISITCLEQLITKKNEPWEKERPIVMLSGNISTIQLIIQDPVKNNTQFYYNFIDWQLDLFKEALKYTFTDGRQLFGNRILMKK